MKNYTITVNGNVYDVTVEEKGAGAAPVAAAPVAAAPVAAAEETGPSKVNVVLTSAGANKLPVIKIIKEVTGLGLKEAKEIADNGGAIKEGVAKEEADALKAQLEEAGASVELQ